MKAEEFMSKKERKRAKAWRDYVAQQEELRQQGDNRRQPDIGTVCFPDLIWTPDAPEVVDTPPELRSIGVEIPPQKLDEKTTT